MRDYYPILLPILALVGIGVLSLTAVSRFGGWTALAEQFRCQESFSGPCWNFQCGQFRWLAKYNNCLTVGADPRGLFLWVFPLFRIGHPPLFIPWREISVSRKKVLWVREVRFSLGLGLNIPLTIGENLARKLQSAAGSSWPLEPVSGR